MKKLKHLLLIWVFSGSLHGLSQTQIDSIRIDVSKLGKPIVNVDQLKESVYPFNLPVKWRYTYSTNSDKLRATLIVYYDKGGPAILHTKLGFVVRSYGKEEVYLDDRMKVIKAPFEVFSYKLKK